MMWEGNSWQMCGQEETVEVLSNYIPHVVVCTPTQLQHSSKKIKVLNRNPEHNRDAVLNLAEVKVYGTTPLGE